MDRGRVSRGLAVGCDRRQGRARGCLADITVGVLGGLLGGWFATEEMHLSSPSGFVGALIVAFLGATVIRLILNAMEGSSRGRSSR